MYIFQGVDRLGVLEVATADARAECAEVSARTDVVARDLRALLKSYHKLRTELADFQARTSFDSHETGSDNGKDCSGCLGLLITTDYVAVCAMREWNELHASVSSLEYNLKVFKSRANKSFWKSVIHLRPHFKFRKVSWWLNA